MTRNVFPYKGSRKVVCKYKYILTCFIKEGKIDCGTNITIKPCDYPAFTGPPQRGNLCFTQIIIRPPCCNVLCSPSWLLAGCLSQKLKYLSSLIEETFDKSPHSFCSFLQLVYSNDQDFFNNLAHQTDSCLSNSQESVLMCLIVHCH